MAYFRCTTGGSGKGNTLVVTCADDLAGATITCTDGTKTYRKTCPSTAPYEVTFYGLVAGTWTVSATVSGSTYTTTVVITDYEAELGGFNWNTWVDLSQNYTSSDFTDLDDLLSDETAVRELMTIHACVDYLAGIAAESADVETIIGNDLCAKWINLNDYALDTLYVNEIIAGYMDTADKYGYGEWALVGQVPKMSSNGTPYGTAFGNGSYTDNPPYYVFDGNDSTLGSGIASASTSGAYIGYHFVNPVCVKRVAIKVAYAYSTQCIVQASNTGNTNDYVDLKEFTIVNSDGLVNVDFANENEYSYYRIYQKSATTAHRFGTNSIQFYAWAPKGNVPIMTANNAPYGVASASSIVQSGYEAYRAFDNYTTPFGWVSNYNVTASAQYLQYKFVNPVRVKKLNVRLTHSSLSASYAVSFNIYGSNDGSTWTDLKRVSLTVAEVIAHTDISLESNNDYYLYYKLGNFSNYVYTAGQGSYVSVCSLQFYGRELSVSVPTMTSNNAPYGTVSVSASFNSSWGDGYKVFTDDANGWLPSVAVDNYLSYHFTNITAIKKVVARFGRNGTSPSNPSFVIEGSNDAITWNNILSGEQTISDAVQHEYKSSNDNAYEYVRIRNTNTWSTGTASWYTPLLYLQFYGLDYSEREFEEGTTKKWLYDHGVELENLAETKTNTSCIVDKKPSSVAFEVPATAQTMAALYATLDLTPYNLFRGVVGEISYANTTTSGMDTGFAIVCNANSVVNLGSAVARSGVTQPMNGTPYTAMSLDVSSFNEEKSVGVCTANGTGTIARKIELKEFWLE